MQSCNSLLMFLFKSLSVSNAHPERRNGVDIDTNCVLLRNIAVKTELHFFTIIIIKYATTIIKYIIAYWIKMFLSQ